MIERFSNRIADLCVKCLPEQKDKRDIIQYGTESITATYDAISSFEINTANSP